MTQRLIRFVLCPVVLAAALAGTLPARAEEALAKGPAGETICAPRAKLLARLEQGRDFTLRGEGVRDAEAMIEIRADTRGNWLMVQTYADGLSCLLAMGEAWQPALPAPQEAAGAVMPADKTDPA